jgi:transcriptional regulator
VPTWNYQAVHISGLLSKLTDAELLDSLVSLSNNYEMDRAPQFDLHQLSPEYLKKELRGIIGFKLNIEDIQATYKLSQNRSARDFDNIIEQLKKIEDHNANEVAKAMRKVKK